MKCPRCTAKLKCREFWLRKCLVLLYTCTCGYHRGHWVLNY